jgi:hypothetical protein
LTRRLPLALLAAASLQPSCGSEGPREGEPAASRAWLQWGRNAQHAGNIDVVGQIPERILATIEVDPFAEQIAGGGALHVHYPVPLLSGDDAYLMVKTGSYTNQGNWHTQEWNWKALRWEGASLRERWSFRTDWKPVPSGGRLSWEPMHQAALTGGRLYAPGFGGSVLRLDAANGSLAARINPFGGSLDPSIFVAGALSVDASGAVYYNAVRLDLANPWGRDVLDSWLVRIAPDDSARTARFTALTPGAPAGGDLCSGEFRGDTLPWPPSVDAVPASAPCGSQRPGLNLAPAIAPDGTIYTVSRAHLSARDGYLVAVNPDLSPRWTASLRDRLLDGCGVPAEQGGVLPANGSVGGCREGSRLGVDPMTNRPGDGSVLDESTASPVVAPDGSILYGAYTRYNYSRGHLMKFSADGAFLAAYGYGWDLTPAIDGDASGYSIVIKDNHYPGAGSYCNIRAFCGTDPGEHSMTRLRGDTLGPEWSTPAPSRMEWCINAPAVDQDGTVFTHSEDGSLYAIGSDGRILESLFLRRPQEAAYTPLSLDVSGRVYAQNAGVFFVVGR